MDILKTGMLAVALIFVSSTAFAFYGHKDYVRYVNYKVSFEDAKEIESSISYVSKKYDLNKDIVLAIARVESTFRKTAIGRLPSGTPQDFGLMQINSKWWIRKWSNPNNLKRLGIIEEYKDYFDIRKNIEGGAVILTVKRDICENRKEQGRLKSNMWECMIKSYHGHKGTTEEYFQSVLDAVLEYYSMKKIRVKKEWLFGSTIINNHEHGILRRKALA